MLAALAVLGAAVSGPPQTDINATRTFRRFPQPSLVPWPRSIQAESDYVVLNNASVIRVPAAAAGELQPLARMLAADMAALSGGALNLSVVTSSSPAGGSSVVLSLNRTALLHSEEYSLAVSAEAPGIITLTAADYEGLMTAAATLLQALEFSGDNDFVQNTSRYNTHTAPAWRVPVLAVHDWPEFNRDGRLLMVDAARNKISLPILKGFVLLCWWYKLGTLHIHLSDDQAFTFPSSAFPAIAQRSAFAYTLAELRELQAFAAARGVTLLGEMDVRHCSYYLPWYATAVPTLPH